MKATDPQTGISIRFVRSWKPDSSPMLTDADHAFLIAVYDARDCSFGEKFRDALAFLQSRQPVLH